MLALFLGELQLTSVTECVRFVVWRNCDALEISRSQSVHLAEGETSLETTPDGLPRGSYRKDSGKNFFNQKKLLLIINKAKVGQSHIRTIGGGAIFSSWGPLEFFKRSFLDILRTLEVLGKCLPCLWVMTALIINDRTLALKLTLRFMTKKLLWNFRPIKVLATVHP